MGLYQVNQEAERLRKTGGVVTGSSGLTTNIVVPAGTVSRVLFRSGEKSTHNFYTASSGPNNRNVIYLFNPAVNPGASGKTGIQVRRAKARALGRSLVFWF